MGSVFSMESTSRCKAHNTASKSCGKAGQKFCVRWVIPEVAGHIYSKARVFDGGTRKKAFGFLKNITFGSFGSHYLNFL